MVTGSYYYCAHTLRQENVSVTWYVVHGHILIHFCLCLTLGKQFPQLPETFGNFCFCFCALVVPIMSSDIWVLCTARAWKSQGGACPCRDHQAGAGGEHFRRQFKASRLYSTYRQHICTAALLPVCCGTPLQMQGLTEDTNICRAFLLLLFQSAHLSSFLIAS